MQDLIPEEEFLKIPHNPWKSFRIYYGVMAVLVVGYLISARLGLIEMMYGAEMVFVPPLVAAVMFLFPRENANIARKDKFLGIFGLIGVIWATMLLLYTSLTIFITGTIEFAGVFQVFLSLVFLAIPHLLLSLFFVAIVSYFYNKKHKPRMKRRK